MTPQRPRLVPKDPPRDTFTTWLWIIAIFLTLALLLLATMARGQTAPTGKVIHCVRQGLDERVTPPRAFIANACKMTFKMPEERDLTVIARRFGDGAVLFSKETTPGETVEILVPIPLGLPGSAEFVRGEIVVLKPASDPNGVLPSNAAPVQETVSAEFLIPAITPAEFIRALVEFAAPQ